MIVSSIIDRIVTSIMLYQSLKILVTIVIVIICFMQILKNTFMHILGRFLSTCSSLLKFNKEGACLLFTITEV